MEGRPKIIKTKSMPHGRWWNKGVKKYSNCKVKSKYMISRNYVNPMNVNGL
ncbi:TPA: hypothetical protein ACP5TR_004377 [Vibrio parahaemolyticus]